MALLYDWISICLWLVELSMHLGANLSLLSSIFLVATDFVLHYNYRTIVILMMAVETPVFSATRIAVIVPRSFVYGNATLPYQEDINRWQSYGTFQCALCHLLLTFERLFALRHSEYERMFSSMGARVAVPVSILSFGGISVLAVIAFKEVAMNVLGSFFVLAKLVSATAIVVVHRLSKEKFGKRHILGLSFDSKFASAESIRATRLYLPVAYSEFVCFVIHLCLTLYSRFFTPYPPGSDPTKLSHVYDLMLTYRILFPNAYITYHQYRNRKKKMQIAHRSKIEVTEHYFNTLNASWKY